MFPLHICSSMFLALLHTGGVLNQANPLEGEWNIQRIDEQGKVDVSRGDGGVIVIKNNKMYIQTGDRDIDHVRIALNVSANPHAIFFLVPDGVQKGEVHKGIFSIEGDAAKLCFGEGSLPTDFQTKLGQQLAILTRIRQKPADGGG